MFLEPAAMLYNAFTWEKQVAQVPGEYVALAETVAQKCGWDTRFEGVDTDYRVGDMPQNNRAMLALSGGLDSVYLMHKLLDQGYDVTAVHVAGLNRSSASKEAEQAAKIAHLAGVRCIKAVYKPPKQVYPDNPFKNQFILGIMLDIGIKRGIYRYAVGSDWGTPLREAVAGFTITDSAEVNRGYWDGVRKHFPQAELLFIDARVKKYDRLQYLFRHHRESLELVSSCVSPLRYREHLHGQNVQKYRVALMPGRCGSCYKCAMEYILLVEAGLVPKDAAYYDHCWHVLATSKTAHRPDLFAESLPMDVRLANLKNYGS